MESGATDEDGSLVSTYGGGVPFPTTSRVSSVGEGDVLTGFEDRADVLPAGMTGTTHAGGKVAPVAMTFAMGENAATMTSDLSSTPQ